jgi:hypothetical protein
MNKIKKILAAFTVFSLTVAFLPLQTRAATLTTVGVFGDTSSTPLTKTQRTGSTADTPLVIQFRAVQATGANGKIVIDLDGTANNGPFTSGAAGTPVVKTGGSSISPTWAATKTNSAALASNAITITLTGGETISADEWVQVDLTSATIAVKAVAAGTSNTSTLNLKTQTSVAVDKDSVDASVVLLGSDQTATTSSSAGGAVSLDFEVGNYIGITVNNPTVTSVTPASGIGGTEMNGTSKQVSANVSVTTNALSGFILSAKGDILTQIADATKLIQSMGADTGDGTISTWAADDGFGICTAAASKVSGFSTGDCTGDNDSYLSLHASTATNVARTSGYSSSAVTIPVLYRVDTPVTQTTGRYTGSVTYTATVNP